VLPDNRAVARMRARLPSAEDQLRDYIAECLIQLLAAAVRSDPSLVAFNRAPDIFSRTRSGRVLEYRREDRPGLVGRGRIHWLVGENGERGEFAFHIRPDDFDPHSVHVNDGPGLSVHAAADYLIHELFLQDKPGTGPRESE
jgi:hypothetical protein